MTTQSVLQQVTPEWRFDKHGVDCIMPFSHLFLYFLLRALASCLPPVAHPFQNKLISCEFLLLKGQAQGLLSQGYLSTNLINHSSSRGQQKAFLVDLVGAIHN